MESSAPVRSASSLTGRVSRRTILLGLGGTALASALLAACGGQAPAATPTPSGPQAVPTTAAAPAIPNAATPTPAAAPTTAPAATPTPAAQATPTAATTAKNTAKEFVGAWPYELPPSGH